MHLFLYGPPGSGKSTIGRIMHKRLDRPLIDLDAKIEEEAGRTVMELFEAEGEAGFRERENRALKAAVEGPDAIVALGGGTLLNPENRALAEATGLVLCLETEEEVLETRISRKPGVRPLVEAAVAGTAAPPPGGVENPVGRLLAERAGHYGSFPHRVKTGNVSQGVTADDVQAAFGLYRVHGMGRAYDVRVGAGLLDQLGRIFTECGGGGRTVVVGDARVLRLYGERAAESLRAAGAEAVLFAIPPGEAAKTLDTVSSIWSAFLRAGIERGGTVVALGGGVTGDLTGFAAAAWLRGVAWINVPTTLLAMVDAGLGGKTGADLPEGKNLIGAFHPPAAVLNDTSLLGTLPACELRCGLAEAIKHDVLADVGLRRELGRFAGIRGLPPDTADPSLARAEWLPAFVSRALSVKVKTISADPYEKGVRAALNLGHTVGHALEAASGFAIRHGEAVAIGTVAAARLAKWMHGLPERVDPGFADDAAACFQSAGLPTEIPGGIDWQAALDAMRLDKKRKGGQIRFVLPCGWGDVLFSPVPDSLLQRLGHRPRGGGATQPA